MTINEYQTEALRTAAGMNHPNNDEILLNGVMGLCGESGECVDMAKKYRFQGHELDKAHLAKRAGRCGVVSRSYRPRYRLRPRDGVADERRQAPQPLPEWVRERAQSSQTGG